MPKNTVSCNVFFHLFSEFYSNVTLKMKTICCLVISIILTYMLIITSHRKICFHYLLTCPSSQSTESPCEVIARPYLNGEVVWFCYRAEWVLCLSYAMAQEKVTTEMSAMKES